MRYRQGAIQDELSHMTTFASPQREQLAGDLALLGGDVVWLEKDRGAHRIGHLAPLRARFGRLL